MEVKIIEHKLRKIQITYGYNDNPWTNEDEELVQALLKMYDHQVMMNIKSDALMSDYFKADKVKNAMREDLLKIKEGIDEVREMADSYDDKLGLRTPDTFIDFAYKIAAVSANITEFDAPFRKFDKKMDKLLNRMNRFTQEIEDDYEVWDVYNDVSHRHSTNYEKNSIDICKYDNEEEMLHGAQDVHGRRRNDNDERCRSSYDDYKCLVLEITVQYAVWDEFLKRFKLLGFIFGEKSMLPGVYVN